MRVSRIEGKLQIYFSNYPRLRSSSKCKRVFIFIKPKPAAIFRTLPRRDIFYRFNAAEHNEILWYRQIKRAQFALVRGKWRRREREDRKQREEKLTGIKLFGNLIHPIQRGFQCSYRVQKFIMSSYLEDD